MSEVESPLYLASAPPPPPEAPWLRLNGLMVLIHPIQELIRLVPVLIGVFFVGREGGWWQWLSLAGIVVVIVRGVSHWYTARYRITDEQVELRSGLVNRKSRAVPRDRIRTVDITAEWRHRIAGLARVKIGTGQHDTGKGDELILDAVSKSEAERLRTLLLNKAPARTVTSEVNSPQETVLARVDRRWTRYAPFTLSGLAVVAALGGALWHFANELHVNPANIGLVRTVLGQVGSTSPWLVALAGVVGLLLVATIASVLGYIQSYWNFTVTREPSGTLHVKHGLLNTRSVSIEESRLRGVEVKETLPLRWVRGGRVSAVVSGLRTHCGDERGGGLLLPAAPVAEAHLVAAKVLREATDPTTSPLTPHPVAALRRRITRAIVSVLVLAALAWIAGQLEWLPAWLWIGALVLVPFAVWVGFDRYRGLGHTLIGGYLISRSGSFVRETVALRGEGVIGWRMRASFFQRRAGLMTLVATTAAGKGSYHVLDTSTEETLTFADAVVPDLVAQFIERS
jgi:putative membrane protein